MCIILNEAEFSIYSRVVEFASRQRLTLQIMQELRPDLLFAAENRGKLKHRFNEFKTLTAQCVDVPQVGTWGESHEWEDFFHGLGCRLKHTSTGEIIEWDAPDVNCFDFYWFVNWLQWAVTRHKASITCDILSDSTLNMEEVISPVLQMFAKKGVLVAINQLNIDLSLKYSSSLNSNAIPTPLT